MDVLGGELTLVLDENVPFWFKILTHNSVPICGNVTHNSVLIGKYVTNNVRGPYV